MDRLPLHPADEPFYLFGPDGPTLWFPHDGVDVSWDLDVCVKCAGLLTVPLSILVVGGRYDDPRCYVLHGERICPPCDWYENEFSNRFDSWEDAQDWNGDGFWEHRRDDYIADLSDALWYGRKLAALREEYSQYVVELIVLKREQARRALREAAPLILPRQVPWSWLENTDYGRFRMDDHPRAV